MRSPAKHIEATWNVDRNNGLGTENFSQVAGTDHGTASGTTSAKANQSAASYGTEHGTRFGTHERNIALKALCSNVPPSLEGEHGTGLLAQHGKLTVWSAADWQAFFDERAAIYEFDAGLSREAAERAAWTSCRIEALCRLNADRHIVGWPKGKLLIDLLTGQMKAVDSLLRSMGLRPSRDEAAP